jgi:aerobic-type carbon monoxide dehydrogenase small subunit (CoxS/CutS family)
MAHDDREKAALSRRAFLQSGAMATGALSSTLLPAAPAEGQRLPDATERDPRRTLVALEVNDVSYRVEVANTTTLAQLLREELQLTGTKVGCDRMQCGACTVIMNGRSVYACTVPAVDAAGTQVLTIEGIARGETLHPIQQAFADHSGYQCGFCTSGQIMSTRALLDRNSQPTEEEARRALSGNLCRCSAYKRILESVMTASRLMRA